MFAPWHLAQPGTEKRETGEDRGRNAATLPTSAAVAHVDAGAVFAGVSNTVRPWQAGSRSYDGDTDRL